MCAISDAATLTAAAMADREHYVVLEAGWRSATATRVVGGEECIYEESFISERANLLDVYDLWLAAVAAVLVKNTRFDPLLNLDSEQRLFADLPALAARAAIEGKVEAAVESEGARFAVPVESALFADAAQAFYRELARLTRSARIAGEGTALILPAESRRWPGFCRACWSSSRRDSHCAGRHRRRSGIAAADRCHRRRGCGAVSRTSGITHWRTTWSTWLRPAPRRRERCR